jgi:hypothetical protein
MKIASKIFQIVYKFLKLKKVAGILNVYHYVSTATGSKRGLCTPAVASTPMKSILLLAFNLLLVFLLVLNFKVHAFVDIAALVGVHAVAGVHALAGTVLCSAVGLSDY